MTSWPPLLPFSRVRSSGLSSRISGKQSLYCNPILSSVVFKSVKLCRLGRINRICSFLHNKDQPQSQFAVIKFFSYEFFFTNAIFLFDMKMKIQTIKRNQKRQNENWKCKKWLKSESTEVFLPPFCALPRSPHPPNWPPFPLS